MAVDYAAAASRMFDWGWNPADIDFSSGGLKKSVKLSQQTARLVGGDINLGGGNFISSTPTYPTSFQSLEDYIKAIDAAANVGDWARFSYLKSNPNLWKQPQAAAQSPVQITPPSQTSVPTSNVASAALNLASATKPTVPQMIQPYGKPKGFGAFGEKDINW